MIGWLPAILKEHVTPFSVKKVIAAVKSALPSQRPLGHHDVYIGDLEAKYVGQALAGDIAGKDFISRFEHGLRHACGVDQVVALASGTAALHLALLVAGVGPGEEVLVPALTFVATANAVAHAGAIPNFVDGSLSISPYKLRCYLERETRAVPSRRGRLNARTGRTIRAVIAVDLLGIPANYPELEAVADNFGLELIEDAAQALGSTIGNRACGSFGRVATMSFNNNKIVTCNGGGAVLTNDPWLAAKVTQLATTARIPHPWKIEHDTIAYNYRMGSINAALGLAQLEQLPTFIGAKQRLAERYRRAFDGLRDASVLGVDADRTAHANHWLTAIVIDPRFPDERDHVLQALHDEGIKARALFTPLHRLPMYVDHPRDNLANAEDLARRCICLPSGVALGMS